MSQFTRGLDVAEPVPAAAATPAGSVIRGAMDEEAVRAAVAREAARARRLRVGAQRRRARVVWFFRALLAVPFVFMAPGVLTAVAGRPGAVADVSASTADVLGTSAMIAFFVMLAVTPVHTMTGWRWHLVLRRDYGIAMFAIAATDLVLAALTTGDTFSGGFMSRVAGRALLVAGTTAVMLTVPLVVTANRRAQRWLGPHWKRLHRLTYVVWALILFHLFLLFGMRAFFVDAVVVSAPLVVLRVPRVRRWWNTARRTGAHRIARASTGALLTIVFLLGFVPFVRELVHVGTAAFVLHPILD
jgi:sulfoxide reductase heme-binding subunit YedZ